MNITNPLLQFVVAMLIGTLVGIEREKKKIEEGQKGMGGIRTFILFAMAGALSGWLTVKTGNPWLFLVVTLVIGAAISAAYISQIRVDPSSLGLTTEIAALIVYLLGATVLFGYTEIAVALGIATSAVLAFKQPLHGVVDKLGLDDIYAGLKLLIATFIILPILPNQPVDPWNSFNPYRMWWLVILISSLSLIGYVATRWLGSERGSILTGLFGGLVSSTAVTISFAKRSNHQRRAIGALASGLMLAWGIMFFRVVVEVAVVHRPLLPLLAIPLSIMGLCAGVLALLFYRKATKDEPAETDEVRLRNPFSLTSAIQFALMFSLVLLFVTLVKQHLPGKGLYAVAALAGVTDVDAITLSMAMYAKTGGNATTAVISIVIAALTNTVVKCGIVIAIAEKGLRKLIIVSTGLILASAVVSLSFAIF